MKGTSSKAAASEGRFASAGSRSFQSVIIKPELGNEVDEHTLITYKLGNKLKLLFIPHPSSFILFECHHSRMGRGSFTAYRVSTIGSPEYSCPTISTA
jgi:hypothetical protein